MTEQCLKVVQSELSKTLTTYPFEKRLGMKKFQFKIAEKHFFAF